MKSLSYSQEPVLEQAFQRNPELGYEPEGSFHSIQYLEHGAPNPLIRWHYHEEYELHLITETEGKLFVGDYIGRFKPGNLVLTGPRLPHNWISTKIEEEGVKIRDRVIQFPESPLIEASKLLPELKQALPLLERARHGIEFKGISANIEVYMERIKRSADLIRFSIFLELISKLAAHKDYELLSSRPIKSYEDDHSLKQISEIVDYLTEHYANQFSMRDIAERLNMSESQFSRYFQSATGNTFTNFMNRLRINRACTLLLETNHYVSTICYEVGFNNVANFNRRFMEQKKMTPSNYRRHSASQFN